MEDLNRIDVATGDAEGAKVRQKGVWKRFFHMLKLANLPYLWIVIYVLLTVVEGQILIRIPQVNGNFFSGDVSVGSVLKFLGFELLNTAISLVMLFFGRQLLSMFTTSNQDVIEWGMVRMMTTFPFYFAGGLMNALTGAMRGSGHSTAAFVVVLVGACIFRILWILLVFPHYRTMRVLYLAFSISWILISIGCILFLWRAFKKLPAK